MTWIRRRARNARRRRSRLAAVAAPVTVITLLAFLLIPHGARRAAESMMPRTTARPDTTALKHARDQAAVRARESEEALSRARVALEQWSRVAATADTLSPSWRARRDSLAAASANLGRLLRRVESAPLPASYRALGEAAELRTEVGIRALVDSLAEVERNREAFGTAGGVDPIFMALTARASQIGKSIQQRAEAKRLALRTELGRMAPLPQPAPASPSMDTTALAAASESASRASSRAQSALSRARATHRALDDSIAAARRVSAIGASLPAMFGSALVIGLAIAFAAAFVDENRRPRVADGPEAVAALGAPLLARTRTARNAPEQARRRADREVSPLIDRSREAYDGLLSQLAETPAALLPVAIVGDEPAVTAAVAANLASAASHRAHTTLVVDLDREQRSVAAVLRVAPAPGVADLASRSVDWSEVLETATVGRDRSVDVIPSGDFAGREPMPVLANRLAQELDHLRRRYEVIILNVPGSDEESIRLVGVLASSVVVCARTAATPIVWLQQLAASLREAGANVRGVVTWESEAPRLGAVGGQQSAVSAALPSLAARR